MATSIFVTCVLLLLTRMANGVYCITWVLGLWGRSRMSAEPDALMPYLFPNCSLFMKSKDLVLVSQRLQFFWVSCKVLDHYLLRIPQASLNFHKLTQPGVTQQSIKSANAPANALFRNQVPWVKREKLNFDFIVPTTRLATLDLFLFYLFCFYSMLRVETCLGN